jgi:hypothetical protein
VQSLRVVEASAFDARSLGQSSLIAIGGSGGNQQLESLRRRLPAAQQDGGSGAGSVLVAMQALPGHPAGSRQPHFQLWIDGTSQLLLQAGAGMLYRHPLPGSAVRLDAAGRLQALPAPDVSPTPASQAPRALLRLLLGTLVAVAAASILAGLGWQVRKPLEASW